MAGYVVRSYSGLKVPMGGSVLVHGYRFDNDAKAWFNSNSAVILDYDQDYLVICAPAISGTFRLRVGSSYESATVVGDVAVVDDVNGLLINRPRSRSVTAIASAMLGLTPRGFAWYKGSDGVFYRLMRGLSYVVAALYELASSFWTNASPSHTESYSEWEQELRLPEDGVVVIGGDSDAYKNRRKEICRKACRRGGNTIPYFLGILSLFGYGAKIYEYWKNPEKFDGVDFGDDDPNFYWNVEQVAREEDWFECTCEDTCDDYLEFWWAAALEAFFDVIKPSHTKVLYTYVVPGVVHLLSEDGSRLLSEDGYSLIVAENVEV